ncbi:sensor histidine kinase KdpD [Sphingomonas sp.]|uniref:sensor histidine kinase n=1 Tax=Sphingomonas sp. TaxID=28214 RepID=UPI0025D1CDD4|nr:HAMP domain-containing sensor histidine kinase [Sphingomonas sp.]
MPDIVTGRVDHDGLLISADLPLLRLQEKAGGAIGTLLAIPSLAGIVRLARSLDTLVSRNVICANGDHDCELVVRARSDADGVLLRIGSWTPRPQRQPWLMASESVPAKSDPPGDWTWSTNGALEIVDATGEHANNLIGQTLTQAFRLLENATATMPILLAATAGTDFVDQPAVLRLRPDRELSLSGKIIKGPQGNFTGFSGIATVREPAQQKLPEAPLVSLFTTKLDAALRSPLSRIVASADSISNQTDGPLRRDYADYAEDIASAARHLLTLVDDLADLQTVEEPDFRVDTEALDLADLARRAAGLLKVRANERKVRIDAPKMGEVLNARGDYRRILQILVNLLVNAIRYSPDEGLIWIRAEMDGDTAMLIVADQGKGIATTDHVRIFEKFERVDPTEPGGSGLGLFISRRLAQAMGGDIVVDSGPGQGARFVLTLPAA